MDPSFKKLDQINNLHHRTVIIEVHTARPNPALVRCILIYLHSINCTFPIIVFDKYKYYTFPITRFISVLNLFLCYCLASSNSHFPGKFAPI